VEKDKYNQELHQRDKSSTGKGRKQNIPAKRRKEKKLYWRKAYKRLPRGKRWNTKKRGERRRQTPHQWKGGVGRGRRGGNISGVKLVWQIITCET